MTTIAIDSEINLGAATYAKKHNLSVQKMVEDFLKRFQTTPSQESNAVVLPEKWEKLCGILEGVEDKTDDRFNYIINK